MIGNVQPVYVDIRLEERCQRCLQHQKTIMDLLYRSQSLPASYNTLVPRAWCWRLFTLTGSSQGVWFALVATRVFRRLLATPWTSIAGLPSFGDTAWIWRPLLRVAKQYRCPHAATCFMTGAIRNRIIHKTPISYVALITSIFEAPFLDGS